MRLEQILRRQAQFANSLKVAVMEEITKKLIVIGVPVPGDLHARMAAYLGRVKGQAGQPKTYKELGVLCISMAMDILEGTGQTTNRYIPATVEESAPPSIYGDPVETEEDDSVSGLSAHLRGLGAQGFAVTLEDKTLIVYAPKSTRIAPGTLPARYNGFPVSLQEKAG